MKQNEVVLYQVCTERAGDATFDGTGLQYEDKAEAIDHLKKTRERHPDAYLATVTYQRCDDEEDNI